MYTETQLDNRQTESMLIDNEQVAKLGASSGLCLSTIPFYNYIRFFMSFKDLKRTGHKVLAVLSILLTFIVTVLGIMLIVKASPILLELSIAANTGNQSELEYLISDYFEQNIGIILLFFISSLAMWIITMITGFKLKNYVINESDEDSLTIDQKYSVSKLSGVFLLFVPFYFIISGFTYFDSLNNIDGPYASKFRLVVIFILVSNIAKFIPFIGNIFVLFIFVYRIVTGLSANEVLESKKVL